MELLLFWNVFFLRKFIDFKPADRNLFWTFPLLFSLTPFRFFPSKGNKIFFLTRNCFHFFASWSRTVDHQEKMKKSKRQYYLYVVIEKRIRIIQNDIKGRKYFHKALFFKHTMYNFISNGLLTIIVPCQFIII